MDVKNYSNKVYVVKHTATLQHYAAFPCPGAGTSWKVVDFDVSIVALKPYYRHSLHHSSMNDPLILVYFLHFDEVFDEISEEMYELLYEKN